MRVLFLTQLFQPEPNHLKGLAFAKAVRSAGIDLRVLTGFPNYPGGRIYPGYRMRPVFHEVLEGVPVTRVAMYPSHDRSAMRRSATYLSFAASASLAVSLSRFKPDIVHSYVGPMTLAIPASVARLLRGARTLLDVEDLWPESVTASGMGGHGAAGRAISSFCQWAYRHSDHFIVPTPGYKRILCERGVPAGQIDTVYNWCDESQIPPIDPPVKARAAEEPFRILYAGNLGTVQALDVVLDAARLLAERGIHVEFTIAGTGVDSGRLQSRQQSEGIPGVRFLGAVPPGAMGKTYAEADALLMHLRDGPLSRVSIPQKTQMYLAAGRPVLSGVRGEATAIVERAQAGVAFEPESVACLAEAVGRLYAMSPGERRALGDNGRKFYDTHLSFGQGVEAVLGIYRFLASGQPARSE